MIQSVVWFAIFLSFINKTCCDADIKRNVTTVRKFESIHLLKKRTQASLNTSYLQYNDIGKQAPALHNRRQIIDVSSKSEFEDSSESVTSSVEEYSDLSNDSKRISAVSSEEGGPDAHNY